MSDISMTYLSYIYVYFLLSITYFYTIYYLSIFLSVCMSINLPFIKHLAILLLSVYQYMYYLLPTSSSITYHHFTMVYIASIYQTIIHLLSMCTCIYHISIICHQCICFYLFAFIYLLNFHFSSIRLPRI